MFISTPDMIYSEHDDIEFDFNGRHRRIVKGYYLVMARRAIQDAIISRITPDANEDVLTSMVYAPMFDERLVLKFDPDGLAFFVHPLKKDSTGAYADTNHMIPIEFMEEIEDDDG